MVRHTKQDCPPLCPSPVYPFANTSRQRPGPPRPVKARSEHTENTNPSEVISHCSRASPPPRSLLPVLSAMSCCIAHRHCVRNLDRHAARLAPLLERGMGRSGVPACSSLPGVCQPLPSGLRDPPHPSPPPPSVLPFLVVVPCAVELRFIAKEQPEENALTALQGGRRR